MSEEQMATPRDAHDADLAAEPLTPMEARLAGQDALRRAGVATGEVMASRRQKVEVETKRLSDEVTEAARRRAIAARQKAASVLLADGAIPIPAQGSTAGQQVERRLPAPLAIRRLLVPLDGSPYAERALPYAAALASATGAGVTLAHIRVPSAPIQAPHPSRFIADHMRDRPEVDISDFATYLNWIGEWLTPCVPEVAIRQVDAASAKAGLIDLEEHQEIDVVVVASHARQGAERLILGSVADDLVRQGFAPALVIPPLAESPEESIPLIKRVLVPLDGSELAEQALGPVIGWLGNDPPSELAPRVVTLLVVAGTQTGLRHAERYAQDVRTLLVPLLPSVRVTARAVIGSAPGAIVDAADRGLMEPTGEVEPSDLIAMATHGRGGFGRWLYGSVASYVLSHAHVPVLLTHPISAEG